MLFRSDARLDASMRGTRDPKAQAALVATIVVAPDGKITGTLGEKNCKVQGVGTPNAAATVYRLNVMLSECRMARFNRAWLEAN